MTINILVFGASGLLLIALAVPLIRGRVAPNPLYGLRCRETLADPVVWYRANALSARWMAALGGGLLVLVLALPWIPGISAEVQAGICTAWLVVGLLVVCGASLVAARRLAAERKATGAGR
jgi:hypothetical protein